MIRTTTISSMRVKPSSPSARFMKRLSICNASFRLLVRTPIGARSLTVSVRTRPDLKRRNAR